VGCDRVFGVNAIAQLPYVGAQPGFPPAQTRLTSILLTIVTQGSNLTIRKRSTGLYETFLQVAVSPVEITYTDTSVTAGTTYFYEAVDDQGMTTPETSAAPWNLFVTGVNQLDPNLRNDLAAVGMVIVVGPNPVTVTALGRFMVAGNLATHTMMILDGSSQAPVATVAVTPGGIVDSFVYAALDTPATLAANAKYYVVSVEQIGGDQFHNGQFTQVSTTAAARITGPVSEVNGTFVEAAPEAGFLFGPLDFLYL
jgi:hypothetical protein